MVVKLNHHLKKKCKNDFQQGGHKKKEEVKNKELVLCCNLTKETEKKFKNKTEDGKIYDLPRRFTKQRCAQGIKGYTMKSSCTLYKFC